jgi:CubicO group peptidase (beta-lactamase class C family)
MKIICFLLSGFILLLSTSFYEVKSTPKLLRSVSGSAITIAEMDEFLKTNMDSFGLPGVSIAIINDSKLVYHRSMGVVNIDTKERLSGNTLFDAGSLTKTPFTYLVMKMVDQGLLKLDQPLYTYLPYPDIAHDERYKLITARMVLSHTTGFPNWRFQNKEPILDIKFTPGTKVSYSGEGFVYLAKVIAHLKNIPVKGLEQLFQEEVARPLGMKYAYLSWNDNIATHRAAGHVDGKVAEGWGITASKPDFNPAHSLQTEAVSYARFLIGMIEGKGLKKETHNEMLRVQKSDKLEVGNIPWCLGIQSRTSPYGRVYEHNGSNWNFTCNYFFNKDKKFGYVFFTNSDKALIFNQKLEGYLTNKKL